MNKEQAAGQFEQVKGSLKETWGKLTDDDIALYNGKREQFMGKLKEHYGLEKEAAEKKIKTLEDACTSDGAAHQCASPDKSQVKAEHNPERNNHS